MSVKVLEGKQSIGGYEVAHLTPNPTTDPDPLSKYIRIHHRFHTISIQLQNGPIKEVGVNGAQVDAFIDVAKEVLTEYQKAVPHPENEKAIVCLNGALEALGRRTKDRILRGVEGTSGD